MSTFASRCRKARNSRCPAATGVVRTEAGEEGANLLLSTPLHIMRCGGGIRGMTMTGPAARGSRGGGTVREAATATATVTADGPGAETAIASDPVVATATATATATTTATIIRPGIGTGGAVGESNHTHTVY